MAKEYWDTCVFLAYLQNKPEEQQNVDVVSASLRRAEDGDTFIVVSTFVLVELRPLHRYNADHAEVLWNLFHTSRPYLKMVGLSPRIAELAATIGSEHQLKSADAVHVATAWSEAVDVMLTFDGGLLDHNGKIGKPPMSIRLPEMPQNAQLELRP